MRQRSDRGRSLRSGGSHYLCISNVKLIVFITTSQELAELTCHLNLTCGDIYIYLPSEQEEEEGGGGGGGRVRSSRTGAHIEILKLAAVFSRSFSAHARFISIIQFGMNIRGREMFTSTDVCRKFNRWCELSKQKDKKHHEPWTLDPCTHALLLLSFRCSLGLRSIEILIQWKSLPLFAQTT